MYIPEFPPINQNDLSRYIYSELSRLATLVNILEEGHINKTHVAPSKPRDGDIRYADGTNWNPGSGAGVYYYNGSAWTKL